MGGGVASTDQAGAVATQPRLHVLGLIARDGAVVPVKAAPCRIEAHLERVGGDATIVPATDQTGAVASDPSVVPVRAGDVRVGVGGAVALAGFQAEPIRFVA
jgi:hypothetical protein